MFSGNIVQIGIFLEETRVDLLTVWRKSKTIELEEILSMCQVRNNESKSKNY